MVNYALHLKKLGIQLRSLFPIMQKNWFKKVEKYFPDRLENKKTEGSNSK